MLKCVNAASDCPLAYARGTDARGTAVGATVVGGANQTRSIFIRAANLRIREPECVDRSAGSDFDRALYNRRTPMTLTAGLRLGSYEIVAPLGAGGMGEVYRARDNNLGREVAIKVLPDRFIKDAERMARFEREARMLAALNHPNIAAIYGLEQSDGRQFLVLEFVPGQTVADRISARRARHGAGQAGLDMEEALKIARQIAEALEAAHETGIIHRDLKPANVKVTPDGRVKVLDFGLAKAFAAEESSGTVSLSPTLTVASEASGVLLGTAAYMSPEQARGKPVDKRTDIWSFGCLLYECLTGGRPFDGGTVTDTLAAILRNDPDWSALPPATPLKMQDLLRRCLQKEPKQRLHDIADARIEIDEALLGTQTATNASVAGASPKPRASSVPVLLLCLTSLVAGALLAGFATKALTGPVPIAATRLAVTLPPGQRLTTYNHHMVALSPDGRVVAYVAEFKGETWLYVRPMNELHARQVSASEAARGPFFSPDGLWVGFFSRGKLRKVALAGGPPIAICDVGNTDGTRGAAWAPDNTIYFTPDSVRGLWRVSADGGVSELVTTPDAAKGEFTHRWPEILPGGKAILFTMRRANLGNYDDALIGILSLETGKRRTLIEGGSSARYSPTGHVVFGRAGSLLAAPFDLKKLKVVGPAVPVLEDVRTMSTTGAAHFAISPTGTLIYLSGTEALAERTFMLVDRQGQERPLGSLRGALSLPRLSPDGRRLAFILEGASNQDVWIYDIGRGSTSRLTFDPSVDSWPIWAPDGKRVVFGSSRAGSVDLFWKAIDGTGADEKLVGNDHTKIANSWSADGLLLAYTDWDPQTSGDLWILPLKGERKPQPFLRTPFDERESSFSPDGRWMAYSSDESGRIEVYVRPYPGPGEKFQISTDGGMQPIWARNGRELFYRWAEKMMVVPIQTGPQFSAGTPRQLFEGHYVWTTAYGNLPNYDVTADGQGFVTVRGQQEEKAAMQFNVVLNWFEDLKRK
ncbi:MAG: protein kinase domain-containing protein [Acidobacteriota bacterium]